MDYYQLNVDLVEEYIQNIPEMQEYFSNFKNLKIQEIGDGNLNFVYIITNIKIPKETVVLKQAVPYLRVAGEGWPLSKERMRYEINALEFHASVCPSLVPKIYFSSEVMSLVIMENLDQHNIVRGEMNKGKIFPKLADHISTFLASTLFYSSDFYLDSMLKKTEVGQKINTDLCKITEDFVFTHPYEDNDTNEYNPALSQQVIDTIQKDEHLRVAVAQMKYSFMTKAEALLHGDLHIGSIMANEDETYVIDPEFSFYGPMGFDLGALIGNLLMAYFAQDYRQREMGNDPEDYRNWILRCIEEVWIGFERKFTALWEKHEVETDELFGGKDLGSAFSKRFKSDFIKQVFADMIGFAACKMMRRIVGLAKVSDIADIIDLKERAKVETRVLKMGRTMILDRNNFCSIKELVKLARSIG